MVKTSELQWTSVTLEEIVKANLRLEASVYGMEGKRARDKLSGIKWQLKPLCGSNGISKVFYGPRFKRVLVERSEQPIYQPSQITDIKPHPLLFISNKTDTDIDSLKVHKGQILLTRSGTIGICTLVSKSYDDQVFSDDLLRIEPKKDYLSGYIYAFLISDLGRALVTTNNYGAVVQHIEPSHLEDLMIPVPTEYVIKEIDQLIQRSFRNRDESNELIDTATEILIQELKLPKMIEIGDSVKNIDAHEVKLSALNGRFEANYHHTKVDKLVEQLNRNAKKVLTVKDDEISKNLILPGRFKRVYVGEKQGVTFFGGKQIFELDPSNKKYLSLSQHEKRITEQLTLRENMVLVTCSGTIGRVQLTPKHWDGWTANQHVLRIVPASDDIAGYLYIWLQSEYGEALIKRHKYGAVVDELDDKQLGDVPVPIIETAKLKHVNQLALKANQLRFEAYQLEQEAIKSLEDKVLN